MTRLAAAALLALAPAAALAHGYSKDELTIRHPWTRATPPGASAAAGFIEIRNAGRSPERLVGASTPLAERVELHVMVREGEAWTMRERASLDIPARERLVMRPGSTHFMLMGLKRPLEKGERIPFTLRFEHAGTLEVTLEVQAEGSRKAHH